MTPTTTPARGDHGRGPVTVTAPAATAPTPGAARARVADEREVGPVSTAALPDLSPLRRRHVLHLMSAAARRQVYRSAGGRIVYDIPGRAGTYPLTAAMVGVFVDNGWWRENDQRQLELTDAGLAARAALSAVTT